MTQELRLIEVRRVETPGCLTIWWDALPVSALDARDYPVLARLWDNPDDAVYDDWPVTE